MMNNYTAFVEITNTCDKKCKHCFNSVFNNNPAEMNVKDFEKLIFQMKKNGINRIKVVGGEPTLHSRFGDIIQILEDYEVSYDVFTDHKNIIKYIEILKKCKNIGHIRISIDGNKDVHDYIRNTGSYSEMIDVIRILKTNNVPIKMNYTINRLNYGCIQEVNELSKEVGVPISFSVMKICRSKFCDELMLKKNEMNSFVCDLINEKNLSKEIVSNILRDLSDDKCFINSQKQNKDKRHIGCLAGQKNCVVDIYGNVWPCSLLKGEPAFNYGNVFKQNLEDILYKLRGDWSKLRRDYDDCDSCKYNTNCTGGCRSNAYYMGGITGKDPYCLLYSNIYYELDNIRAKRM